MKDSNKQQPKEAISNQSEIPNSSNNSSGSFEDKSEETDYVNPTTMEVYNTFQYIAKDIQKEQHERIKELEEALRAMINILPHEYRSNWPEVKKAKKLLK